MGEGKERGVGEEWEEEGRQRQGGKGTEEARRRRW